MVGNNMRQVISFMLQPSYPLSVRKRKKLCFFFIIFCLKHFCILLNVFYIVQASLNTVSFIYFTYAFLHLCMYKAQCPAVISHAHVFGFIITSVINCDINDRVDG
jgi:hypothetical protein